MTTGGDEPGADRVLTVPNVLSLIRLCLIPVFAWLLLGRDNRAGAATLLAVLGATDWVDGYIARHFDQVSNLGKVLDPAADRLLLGVAVICGLIDGAVPAIVAWPMIVREALVSGTVLVLAAMGARRIDVTWVGKAGTFLLMFALPLFLFGHDDAFALEDPARVAAWGFAAVGLVLSYYAAARYVPLGGQALRDRRLQEGHATGG
ncbi:MAG: CDP-alcohol phosphatidyltransferase family protein [Actinomycetota bacterium]|nr:CDP-alcohol phosphatidyltransferase family protein [Actinomycetota bacterium]